MEPLCCLLAFILFYFIFVYQIVRYFLYLLRFAASKLPLLVFLYNVKKDMNMFETSIFFSRNTEFKELKKVNFRWLHKNLLFTSLFILLFVCFYFTYVY